MLPQSALLNDDDGTHAFQFIPTYIEVAIDEFHLGGLFRCWNVQLVTLLASAAMTVLPSPCIASVNTEYSTSGHSMFWSSSTVVAADDFSSISPSSITELGLKPPTEEKPQIMLYGNDRSPEGLPSQRSLPRQSNAKEREPILQGLVYFPENAPKDSVAKSSSGPQVKQQLDYYSDVLVLTAVSATQPEGPILAGAKFPVSSVRFPFSFQMYKENLLTKKNGVQETWDSVANTEDVILRATICPSDASKYPCEKDETKKSAEGIAKLISNLPGLEEGKVIRAPASLALQ